MERCFWGGQSLRSLPGLTIGRSLHKQPVVHVVVTTVTLGGRWQIVTPGTRAPRGPRRGIHRRQGDALRRTAVWLLLWEAMQDWSGVCAEAKASG